MSEIMIKNMEMPRNCVECFCMNNCDAHAIMMGELLREGCENFMAEFRKGRLDGCPLVEVKSHGRLIDADFFKGNAIRVHTQEGKEYIPADYIDIVPTVLEANNE